jgi:hypothetical protein
MAVFVTEANAACPSGYTYIGGSCYKTKGVDVAITLKNLNHLNLKQNPKSIECNIRPPDPTTSTALLFCGNPSANQPPGKVLVLFSTTFGGLTPINSGDVDQRGNAQEECIALVPQSTLDDLARASCPNTSWTGLDLVPCEFQSELILRDNHTSEVNEDVKHSCSLSDCASLRWDKKNNRPEIRNYDCTGPIP